MTKMKRVYILSLFIFSALASVAHSTEEYNLGKLMGNIRKIAGLVGHHIPPEPPYAESVLSILGHEELNSGQKVKLLSKALLCKEFFGHEKEQMIKCVESEFSKVEASRVLNIVILAANSNIPQNSKTELLDYGFGLLKQIPERIDLKACFAKCLLVVDHFSENNIQKIDFIQSVIEHKDLKPEHKEALEGLLDEKASRFALTDPAFA